MNIVDKYPQAFVSTNESQIEASQALLSTFNKENLTAWTDERTVTQEIGGRAFRMLVDPGEDDQSVVIAFGEFGNGLDATGAVARARVMREFVNPNATLILQPNSTRNQNNPNFSRTERKALHHGDPMPIVDRTFVTLEAYGNPSDVVVNGPSQGGVVALAYGAHPSSPAVAVSTMEAPNVADRSLARLAKDFLGAGPLLKENIADNFESDSRFKDELIADLGLVGFIKYGVGLARFDNVALAGLMKYGTAERDTVRILEKNGSVVQAWATGDSVSPVADNRDIAERLQPTNYFRYKGVELENDHSMTNLYSVSGALAHYALTLRNQSE